jgi:hypothetical protein
MKHITYIILASALLTCSSCSDFLEKYPKDSPSTTIPMSDDLAVAMTNGCYQSLQSMNLYNQRIWSSSTRRILRILFQKIAARRTSQQGRCQYYISNMFHNNCFFRLEIKVDS